MQVVQQLKQLGTNANFAPSSYARRATNVALNVHWSLHFFRQGILVSARILYRFLYWRLAISSLPRLISVIIRRLKKAGAESKIWHTHIGFRSPKCPELRQSSRSKRGRADCLCASYRHAGRRFAFSRVTRSRWTFVMQAEKGVWKKKIVYVFFFEKHRDGQVPRLAQREAARVGRRLLHEQIDRYERGDWPALLASSRGSPPHRPDGSATGNLMQKRHCAHVTLHPREDGSRQCFQVIVRAVVTAAPTSCASSAVLCPSFAAGSGSGCEHGRARQPHRLSPPGHPPSPK